MAQKKTLTKRVYLTFTAKQLEMIQEFVDDGEYGDKPATALQALIMERIRDRRAKRASI